MANVVATEQEASNEDRPTFVRLSRSAETQAWLVEKVTEQTTLMQQTQKHELITSVHAWMDAGWRRRARTRSNATHDDARDAYPGRSWTVSGQYDGGEPSQHPLRNIHCTYAAPFGREYEASGVSTRLERRQRGSAPTQRPAIISPHAQRARGDLPTTDRDGHLSQLLARRRASTAAHTHRQRSPRCT